MARYDDTLMLIKIISSMYMYVCVYDNGIKIASPICTPLISVEIHQSVQRILTEQTRVLQRVPFISQNKKVCVHTVNV